MTRPERRARFIAEAAFQFGVRPDDILSRSRKPKLVLARRDMMRRYRDAGYSLQQIGQILGLHHTTVWEGLRVA